MKTNSNFKIILQYILGILLLICSFPMFAEDNMGKLAALFMIISSLICIPVTRQLIEEKTNIRFGKIFKYLIVIFGWLSIGIFSKPLNKESTENKLGVRADTVIQESPKKDLLLDTTNIELAISKPVKENLSNQEVLEKPMVSNNNYSSESPVDTNQKKKKKSKKSGYGTSNTSGNSGYIRGPRGGCYYINSNGKKVYVDHSYCN